MTQQSGIGAESGEYWYLPSEVYSCKKVGYKSRVRRRNEGVSHPYRVHRFKSRLYFQFELPVDA